MPRLTGGTAVAQRRRSANGAPRRSEPAREAAVVETPARPRQTRKPDAAPASGESRVEELRKAVSGLRTRAGSINLERAMLTAGAILLPLGIVAIGLGWFGASRSPYEFEQIPYLISGGLLGVAFVIMGGFLYFGYWLTTMVQEQRAQSQRLLDVLDRLEARLGAEPVGAPQDTRKGSTRRTAGTLVATEHGSMYHRPDCVVVKDASGVRRVTGNEPNLEPCALCL